jgi:hypothetical protein
VDKRYRRKKGRGGGVKFLRTEMGRGVGWEVGDRKDGREGEGLGRRNINQFAAIIKTNEKG